MMVFIWFNWYLRLIDAFRVRLLESWVNLWLQDLVGSLNFLYRNISSIYIPTKSFRLQLCRPLTSKRKIRDFLFNRYLDLYLHFLTTFNPYDALVDPPRARTPAVATCTSCPTVPPLTPIPPIRYPSRYMGRLHSGMLALSTTYISLTARATVTNDFTQQTQSWKTLSTYPPPKAISPPFVSSIPYKPPPGKAATPNVAEVSPLNNTAVLAFFWEMSIEPG